MYNEVSNCILVCPITSNIDPWPWKVLLPDTGVVKGAVLADQIKSIDVIARNLDVTDQMVGDEIMDEVLAKLATLIAH